MISVGHIVAGYFLYILYNCHIQNILYIVYSLSDVGPTATQNSKMEL